MVIEDLVSAASDAYGVADAATSPGGSDSPPPVTIDEPVNKSKDSSVGGRITVTGKVTGTANPAAKALSLALDVSETISDYKFQASGETYAVNGAPSVAATGTITASGGNITAYHMTLKGTFIITHGGLSRTCPIAVDIQASPDGNSTVTGMLCGERFRRTI